MDRLREKIERLVRQVVAEKLADGQTQAPVLEQGRRPLVAANWKMNMNLDQTRRFVEQFDPRPESGVEVLLCPPHLLLWPLAQALGSGSSVRLGAQNCHTAERGAFTGEHSPPMIRDSGADYVLIGHSERRALFGEDDALVQAKVQAVLQADLRPVLCVGESLAQREAGITFRVLRNQLSGALSSMQPPAPDPACLVVAYEPVWAIGTGRTASASQAQEALAFIRECLAEIFSWAWAERVRLLYGGSANPENAASLAAQADLDGFLVGGASLDPEKLSVMIAAGGEVWAARTGSER